MYGFLGKERGGAEKAWGFATRGFIYFGVYYRGIVYYSFYWFDALAGIITRLLIAVFIASYILRQFVSSFFYKTWVVSANFYNNFSCNFYVLQSGEENVIYLRNNFNRIYT